MICRVKLFLKYLFAVLFVAAGVNHYIHVAFYVNIMPPYVPFPVFLVYLSGVFEVALGLMLIVPKLTRFAAWGLIALLIAVSPVHIHMLVHRELYPQFSVALLWLRLPIQIVFIAWAYWFTRV